MLPNVIVHESDMKNVKGGGGRDQKMSVKGVFVNRPSPTTDSEGMDTLLMVVSIVRRTCSRVTGPLGIVIGQLVYFDDLPFLREHHKTKILRTR